MTYLAIAKQYSFANSKRKIFQFQNRSKLGKWLMNIPIIGGKVLRLWEKLKNKVTFICYIRLWIKTPSFTTFAQFFLFETKKYFHFFSVLSFFLLEREPFGFAPLSFVFVGTKDGDTVGLYNRIRIARPSNLT